VKEEEAGKSEPVKYRGLRPLTLTLVVGVIFRYLSATSIVCCCLLLLLVVAVCCSVCLSVRCLVCCLVRCAVLLTYSATCCWCIGTAIASSSSAFQQAVWFACGGPRCLVQDTLVLVVVV
jgi:hypothetical protein